MVRLSKKSTLASVPRLFLLRIFYPDPNLSARAKKNIGWKQHTTSYGLSRQGGNSCASHCLESSFRSTYVSGTADFPSTRHRSCSRSNNGYLWLFDEGEKEGKLGIG